MESGLQPVRRKANTTPHSTAHNPAPSINSFGSGEKISRNPRSFTSAAKLDTQKGIRNNRNVCQNPSLTSPSPDAVVLITSATPIITLSPSDVSHSLGLGEKYRASTTQYQMK